MAIVAIPASLPNDTRGTPRQPPCGAPPGMLPGRPRGLPLTVALLAFALLAGVLLSPLPASAGPGPSIDYAELVETYGPAVVHVSVRNADRGNALSAETASGDARPARGFGTGFVVSTDGYIITNEHVVSDSVEVRVQFSDRRNLRARVVGTDPQTDIALLKIDASGLPAVRIGAPERVRVGEPVAAIGSPFGYEHSVTAGIVSAKSRNVDDLFVPFIQTDAAINPGNSGGPLFNAAGEVIGVNSRIVPRAGGFVGLSFAVPIDIAMQVAEQLKRGTRVVRGRIGVTVQPVSAELARAFGLERARGALVTDVEDDGPAAQAGLRSGDVVMAVQGRQVDSSLDLPRMISAMAPGARAALELVRDGEPLRIDVAVEATSAAIVSNVKVGRPGPEGRIGLAVRALTADEKRRWAVDDGVAVESVVRRSAAFDAEVRPGDVLVAVRGRRFSGVAGFRQELQAARDGALALLLMRNGQRRFVAIESESLGPERGPLAGADTSGG